MGRSTINTYDRRQRLTESTDALGGKTRYAYDTRDNLLSLTDANDNTHRFTFDKVNRTLTEARPLGQTIRYVYDPNGNLKERIDPLNQRAVHRYDDANRRDRTEHFEAGATTPHKTVDFSFDERNLLTGYDDGTTSAVYVYDDLGRKTGETVDYGNFNISHSYSYYANGQKQSYTAPDGTLITYAYSAHGQLNRLSIPGEGDIVYSNFKWTRPQTITYPGNTVRTVGYDALLRTKTIHVRNSQNQVLMDYGYDYDAVGNITEKRTEYGPHRYQYDNLDRLTVADYPNGPQSDQINDSFLPNTFPFADDRYSYDLIGNRQTDQAQTTTTPWAYNGNNELLHAGFAAFDYDAAGSTIAERDPQTDAATRSYRYNSEERMSEVRGEANQPIASYYYDPMGRRLWKTLQPGAEGHSGVAGPETTYLAYSDEGYAAEFTLPGEPGAAPAAGPAANQYSNVWLYGPENIWSNDPISSKTRAGWRFPQNDHIGTPQLAINSLGATHSEMRVAAFGSTRVQGELQPLRFAGQLTDSETGANYNYFRNYRPQIGAYIESDPLGINGGIGLFMYSNANPLTRFDPFGLCTISGVWETDPTARLLSVSPCWFSGDMARTLGECWEVSGVTAVTQTETWRFDAIGTVGASIRCREDACECTAPREWSLAGRAKFNFGVKVPIPVGICKLAVHPTAVKACQVARITILLNEMASAAQNLSLEKIRQIEALIKAANDPDAICKSNSSQHRFDLYVPFIP